MRASPRSKALGRGLDALLGPGTGEGARGDPGREIPVELIRRSAYQPRRKIDADALEDLTRSVRAHGVIQPVVVRPVGEDRYELVAGERRWRAAQAAGLETVPAVVREVSDEVALTIAIIENIQREDLNSASRRRAALKRLDRRVRAHPSRDLAEAVGRSRASVTNLHAAARPATRRFVPVVESGELEMGHARALLGPDARSASARGRVAWSWTEGSVGA